jgi:hypothetical protein
LTSTSRSVMEPALVGESGPSATSHVVFWDGVEPELLGGLMGNRIRWRSAGGYECNAYWSAEVDEV